MRKGNQFRLVPPMNGGFWILVLFALLLMIYMILSNKSFNFISPFFLIVLLFGYFVMFLNDKNNFVLVKKNKIIFLIQSLSLITTPLNFSSWDIEELNMNESCILLPKTEEANSILRLHEILNDSVNYFGLKKLKNNQTIFRFLSRTDVPLVIIPIKSGGHILLSLENPEAFIAVLKEAHANT